MNDQLPKANNLIRDLVGPLIERNSDIVLTGGKFLTLLPVGHVARQIRIHNRPTRGYFTLEWRCTELYIRDSKLTAPGYGRPSGLVGRSSRFKTKGEDGLWEWRDRTMWGDFVDQVEAEILPVLRPLSDFEKMVKFISSQYYFGYLIHRDPIWMSMTLIALGQFQVAHQHWCLISPSFEERFALLASRTEAGGKNYYQSYRDIGDALRANDQRRLAEILREHEKREASNFKLDRYWLPTLFPFERSDGMIPDQVG